MRLKVDGNEPAVVRTCAHCGVSLTREWEDELCVCGQPAPAKETPRRIQLGPSQLSRGMGRSGEAVRNERERSRLRRAKMSDEQRDAERRRQREKRQSARLRRSQVADDDTRAA